MRAIEKINAIGVPQLAQLTGRSPSILYRWRKTLAKGEGIADRNKRQLIAASLMTPHPIGWLDFVPQPATAAA